MLQRFSTIYATASLYYLCFSVFVLSMLQCFFVLSMLQFLSTIYATVSLYYLCYSVFVLFMLQCLCTICATMSLYYVCYSVSFYVEGNVQNLQSVDLWFLGKGVNVWDTFTHEGGHVVNNETGDVACDSYHKYKEDVQLMKSVGVKLG